MALDTSKVKNRNGIVSNSDVPSVKRDNSKIILSEQELSPDCPSTPLDIYTELNRYVVGQHEAKKALSVAAANHLKRMAMKDPTVKKSNVMLVGPSGCGKTHLVSTLAKILDVPFASVSANSMTAAGYVGGNVEDCLRSLIFNASNMEGPAEKKSSLGSQATYHIARAEHGIIMIDEVDKIRKKMGGSGRDIGGESVQQGLLTMIEGTVMNVNIKGSQSMDDGGIVSIDTSNILFVFSGAFPDIQDIVKNRLTREGISTFEMDEDEVYANVKEADLESFGMIPEFIGRIPVISHIRSLNEDDFARILVEPKDAIFEQYRKLFMADGATLKVTQELIGYIAQKAKEKKRGARGLRTVLEDLLADAQFISASYPDNGLEFFVKLFDDGEPGTIVKAPKKLADEIRMLISSGNYGNFTIEIVET